MCALFAATYPERMVAARHDAVIAVCRVLEAAGDADRARGQQAYMKSVMPFRGITAPALRASVQPVLADPAYQLSGRDEWDRPYQGWAGARSAMSLRQYAQSGTDAAGWVRRSVDELGSRLSPLSRREALKHLG